MINWQTILSNFDNKPTLLQYLKEIKAQYDGITVSGISSVVVNGNLIITITFDNGTTVSTAPLPYADMTVINTAIANINSDIAAIEDELPALSRYPQLVTANNSNAVDNAGNPLITGSISYTDAQGQHTAPLSFNLPITNGDNVTFTYSNGRLYINGQGGGGSPYVLPVAGTVEASGDIGGVLIGDGFFYDPDTGKLSSKTRLFKHTLTFYTDIFGISYTEIIVNIVATIAFGDAQYLDTNQMQTLIDNAVSFTVVSNNAGEIVTGAYNENGYIYAVNVTNSTTDLIYDIDQSAPPLDTVAEI